MKKKVKLRLNNRLEERLAAGRQEHSHVIKYWKGGGLKSLRIDVGGKGEEKFVL